MSLPATLPDITPANRPFWDAAARGELRLPHCAACGHTWFPPGPARCPGCLAPETGWRTASGRGTLWSWIVMHRQYFRDFPPPYVVAFVQLEEGPMVMARVALADEPALRCDLPVRAVFDRLSDEVAVLRFESAA